MDGSKIKKRVEGRKLALEVVDLIGVENLNDPEFMRGVVSELKKHLWPENGRQKDLLPIARLGRTVVNFGRHQGKAFDDIELDYLDWLCRQHEDFYRDLKAYLTHPDLKKHRPESVQQTELF